MTEQEFHQDLVQTVAARAAATSDYTDSAFAHYVTEGLEDSGSIDVYQACSYKHRGTRIDGYGFSEEDGAVDLFIVDYRGGDEIESLTRTALDQCVKRVETFADQAFSGTLHEEIDVTHPAWGFSRQLHERSGPLKKVRVHIVSDAKLSSSVKELPARERDGREWQTRVWDLSAIFRLMTTGEPEDIVIDFKEMFGQSLICLPANSGSADVSSYLTVVPGNWLAEIYSRYAGRLLEQNVRTFLQVKGSVNKGIRRTILEEPHMFFAYNNGISATAAEADFARSGEVLELNRVRHLQIVNGGQTTASIFNVLKKDKAENLEKIRVQMKLSVVRPELVNEVVPRISEYANSQNKVSAADFFSNHPFHVRVEAASRRIWAPASEGGHLQTHWFYERARGQYVNAAAYLTPAKKREFELHNPKKQLVQKTDLAKVVMSFRGLPHVVSSGAQKNFAKFAEYIAAGWDTNSDDFGDDWYRNAIAMTIIFRSLEKLVQDASWYAQGYRANIVTYTIALAQHTLARRRSELDFGKIWRRQSMSSTLGEWFIAMAHSVQDRIIKSAADYRVSNVTEWCKREKCWDDIRENISTEIPQTLLDELLSREEVSGQKRAARQDQKVLNGVEAQTAVVGRGNQYWSKLLTWAKSGILMTPTEIEFLTLAAKPRAVPSAAQSERILQIEQKAVSEGFRPDA